MLTTFGMGCNFGGGGHVDHFQGRIQRPGCSGGGGQKTVVVNYPQLQIQPEMAIMLSRSTCGFTLITVFLHGHDPVVYWHCYTVKIIPRSFSLQNGLEAQRSFAMADFFI